MKKLPFHYVSRHNLYSRPFKGLKSRQSSTDALQSKFQQELTRRPHNRIFDYLSPVPSHLLNVTLSDFLPDSCQPPGFSKKDLELPVVDTGSNKILPQGHHLVYFSPQVPSSSLLPDGTDYLQSPGSPFDRRMWAGGAVTFSPSPNDNLLVANGRVCCTESISDVAVRGVDGDEKVFVTIKREVSKVLNAPNSKLQISKDSTPFKNTDQSLILPPSMVEERNLVYFRTKTPKPLKDNPKKPVKILKPAQEPDFSVTLTPTTSLLFRFSALTFNAHAIHLDPQYCREVEGHRNLLVHGPLSLVLMFSVLRSQLQDEKIVLKLEYRNVAPIYVDEPLRVCVRKDKVKEDKYDVWIEGKDGGYAVKGSAVTGALE